LKRIRVIVHGDVQGVGFRAATAQQARRANVAGWVRNLRDGSVEVEAEGSVQAIDELIRWLRRGPSLARVTAVEIDDSQLPAGLEGFSIRP
jgi:acylphosphatase